MDPSKSYQPVATNDDSVRLTEEDVDDSPHASNGESMMRKGVFLPLNIDQDFDRESLTEFTSSMPYSWFHFSIPFAMITLCLSAPVALGNVWLLYHLTGLFFISIPFLCHLILISATSRWYLSDTRSFPCWTLWATLIVALIDMVLLCLVYPLLLWNIFAKILFTEADGTTSNDWIFYQNCLIAFRVFAYLAGSCRCTVALYACYALMKQPLIQRTDLGITSRPAGVLRSALHCFSSVLLLVSLLLLMAGICSVVLRFGAPSRHGPLHRGGSQQAPDCDPLDTTECWLPFPSFHALRPDTTTATGWRVQLQGHLLPPLRNRQQIQPAFLNRLDGFSTLAPLLFYIEGLKEAHEAGIGQLMRSDRIAESVTERSATLLLDVTAKALVYHTAEIDYLDNKNPMVMIFPAQPLYHNRHYAVAVVNARDSSGQLLSPTPGMMSLLFNATDDNHFLSPYDTDRERRYREVLIPSLEHAAPWFHFVKDPRALQLLFDFHTISEESQLGPVRKVRDTTISLVSSDWNWTHHVRINRRVDYTCDEDDRSFLARTVHAEIDVPWFLKPNGKFRIARAAVLDSRLTDRLGVAKFVVHIPCSLQSAALGRKGALAKPLRSVMEFGHGLFGSRGEASDDYLLQMAHNQGYVIIAMDWRGMSTNDLPLVIKVLGSTPHLFESVRDNLIQGYACKYAMQHFARNALLSTDWLSFPTLDGYTVKTAPLFNNSTPAFVFYGVSQGGILGSGYSALSGVTGLIDRSIIGSGGTPFALILTRSQDFFVYDKVLQLNFYCNRHVRMLLSLVQMAWDPVEASGVLAPPVHEPFPRVLLQAGLGDVIVPTTASEVLSRAFNASTLPKNPRVVFGVPAESSSDAQRNGPYATLTEVMYDHEYKNLPMDNVRGSGNPIHICLRRDYALIEQLTEFVNSGKVVDPCTYDGCHRVSPSC